MGIVAQFQQPVVDLGQRDRSQYARQWRRGQAVPGRHHSASRSEYLLACVFFLFVLCQWMRDAKRKTTTRPVIDNELGETRNTKHLQIVRARRAVGRCESGYDELERIA